MNKTLLYPAGHTFVARSDELAVSIGQEGEYWLHTAEGIRPAEPIEQMLAEMLAALARLKLPGAIPDGRRPA